MEETQTWRDLLGKVISDPSEKQRIADTLGVKPITLTRWATGVSNPRQDNLLPLLDALPHYHQQFSELIPKEFPHFFPKNSTIIDHTPQEIPSAFYARVLNAHANSPVLLRASSICILILQQLLGHLDPRQTGVMAFIAQCVPPVPGHKVRSLRKTLGRATTKSWEAIVENWTQFYGAESQTGQATTTGHPIIIHSSEDRLRWFPAHHTHELEGSSVVYPILFADRVAGSLCIVSKEANYFSQTHLDLIEDYVELMVLAFERNEFYRLHDIELGLIPSREIQQPYLAQFHQRVTHAMIAASQNNIELTRREAELKVWQDIEEELLQVAFDPNSRKQVE